MRDKRKGTALLTVIVGLVVGLAIVFLARSETYGGDPTLWGDADCDGMVNSLDALLILQLAAGHIDMLPCEELADFDESGTVDALDALLVLQFVAGSIDHPGPTPTSTPSPTATPTPPETPVLVTKHVLEDFNDIVTATDFGLNDFSGSMGLFNWLDRPYGVATVDCKELDECDLSISWDFTGFGDEFGFTGWFFTLFGRNQVEVSFDGVSSESVPVPGSTLDLDNIDGAIAEPGGPRRYTAVCFAISYEGEEAFDLRLELKDASGGARMTRILIAASASVQEHCWDFRDPSDYQNIPNTPDLNIHEAQELVLLIERFNDADGVVNPDVSSISIRRVSFTVDPPDRKPATDEEFLELLQRRAYQYFQDWSSRFPDSMWLPRDRSTFPDLMTIGGVGFALPAHVVAADKGWISRDEAAARVLTVLELLDDPAAFGPAVTGTIGHNGFFVHFVGPDGRRKLDVGDPVSRVEISTIDTALAVLGGLVAQSYFDDEEDATEAAIRTRAQSIYDRVDWSFMLEPISQQFYWAWMPELLPGYEIPDGDGNGYFVGTPGAPATIDIYTDEALIISILAAGSETHPVPAKTYCAWDRPLDGEGLVRSWTGALFTYQFLRAFLDTNTLVLPDCPGEEPVDWYENSREAMERVVSHAEQNPSEFSTYGPCAWGISATEGPDDRYRAYGAADVRVSSDPGSDREDGTVATYAMAAAAAFGEDLKQDALCAVRQIWNDGLWHGRFGPPDSFNADVGQAVLDPVVGNGIIRDEGSWNQRALFAIDQGPMLLHLANEKTGLVWQLTADNPNIQRALARLIEEVGTSTPTPTATNGSTGTPTPTPTPTPKPTSTPTFTPTPTPTPTFTPTPGVAPEEITLEAEDGTGPGSDMPRSNASNQFTNWLHVGESVSMTFNLPVGASYAVEVRYSNDGGFDTVDVDVDGNAIGQFITKDTRPMGGSPGDGWNAFNDSGVLGTVVLAAGDHKVEVEMISGDSFGVEIDVVTLKRVD